MPQVTVNAVPVAVGPTTPIISGVNPSNNSVPVAVDPTGKLLTSGTGSLPGFNIPAYDYIALTYFGTTNNLQTVVYKTGGISGATVATLTLTYKNGATANNDLIATVTKS